MARVERNVLDILEKLQTFYGVQEPSWPTDPYLFLIWWHCGYPASDTACAKGWKALGKSVGTDPSGILSTPSSRIASALKLGGMVPEIRAERLKEIARRVQNEFDGDLRSALVGPVAPVRKVLTSFPGIADPGADRILLFAGIQPVAAIPSNCTHVLVRILGGRDEQNYTASYDKAQKAIEAAIPEKFDARTRAYLLLKRHEQEICKRT